jgi:hypothetical protein
VIPLTGVSLKAVKLFSAELVLADILLGHAVSPRSGALLSASTVAPQPSQPQVFLQQAVDPLGQVLQINSRGSRCRPGSSGLTGCCLATLFATLWSRSP